jgi:hypothetical protein
MQFLMRPQKIDLESWPGFLMRFAEANALHGIAGLAAFLGCSSTRLVSYGPSKILPLLEIPSRRLAFSGVYARGHVAHASRPATHRMHHVLFRSRVCPACLETDSYQYIRFRWDQPVGLTCSKHCLLLSDECSECGMALTLTRNRVCYCDCGLDLRRLPRSDSDEAIKCIEYVFAGRIADYWSGDVIQRIKVARKRSELINQIFLVTQENAGPVTSAMKAFVTREVVTTVAPFFASWPSWHRGQIARLVKTELKAPRMPRHKLIRLIVPALRDSLRRIRQQRILQGSNLDLR